MENEIKHALATLSKAMQDDPEYAWGWQCNLAMMAVDAGAKHKEANIRAADLIKHVFKISTHEMVKQRLDYE